MRLPRRGSVVLIALSVLAGCIGSAEAAMATATETLDPATAAALRWSPDAQLAQAFGVEGSYALAALALDMSEGDVPAEFEAAARDDDVGDGKTAVWAYRFVSPTEAQAYLVLVDSGGKILHEAEDEAQPDDEPVGTFSIDSDEAVALAREANAGLATGRGSDTHGIGLMLHRGPGGAAWLVAGGGMGPEGVGGGFVLLDANTGEILASEGGARGAGWGGWP